ncbi:hypothetical protein FJ970_10405 [Mesorhizobium sp. B2-1-8]|uniref:hypothetical protein n=1 Tax=Mesorhizobium sp. B2-1-8 TaxID=2589967 RepID=UPI001D103807|nr:hypothetical protein [Mesorhizobium sp. B2-1-8]UCI21334.1 hypothetical protein FJ970_10405 [Mesorhizobium sp. B2-1-8]
MLEIDERRAEALSRALCRPELRDGRTGRTKVYRFALLLGRLVRAEVKDRQ